MLPENKPILSLEVYHFTIESFTAFFFDFYFQHIASQKSVMIYSVENRLYQHTARFPRLGGIIFSVLKDRGVPSERANEAIAASNGSVGKALELSSDEEYWKLRDEVMKCFFSTTSRSDVLKISNQWKDRKQEAEEIFSILESYVKRITEARFGERKPDLSFLPEQWQRFSEKAEIQNFVLLTENIINAKRQLQFSTNFQAVLERIIFVFMGEGNVWLQ